METSGALVHRPRPGELFSAFSAHLRGLRVKICCDGSVPSGARCATLRDLHLGVIPSEAKDLHIGRVRIPRLAALARDDRGSSARAG